MRTAAASRNPAGNSTDVRPSRRETMAPAPAPSAKAPIMMK